jgi:pSer/pThr/pTyr-binding forkhead associated (FHA) protein
VADQEFQLVVRKGPRPGQIFPLSDDAISIGRDPVSEIVIDDPEISRHHARLTIGPAGYYLQDLASTNGSFVDGERLSGEPYALNPGQVVMFGSNVTLVYQAIPESDPLATVVAPVSLPLAEELIPDEPVESPAQEPLEVDEEVVIAEVVASDSFDADEEEIAVEVAAPESFEIEEEEVVDEVAAPESFEIEEEEVVDEVAAPEFFEVEEEEFAAEEAAPESVEIEEEEVVVDAAVPDSLDVDEEVVVAAAVAAEPDIYFEKPDDDEDLATIIDEPVIVEEPSPEPEIEPGISEGFPTFDGVEDEPAQAFDQAAAPAPFVFEEPEPEAEIIQEVEVAAPVFEEPLAAPDYGIEATMPDVDFQPVIEPPTETMEPSDEPKGGVDRTVIIAVVMLVIMCCCVFGAILTLIAVDTWIQEDLIKGLELGAVGFFQGMKSLIH